jgi:hypothetical protein
MEVIRLFENRRLNMDDNQNTEKETVTLNGREVSQEELQRQKEAAAAQKGAKLEEVSKGNYKMRLQD